MRKWSHFSLILVSFSFLACASAQIYHEGKHISSKDELFQSLKGSQVILLGENHGFRTHRDQHMEILRELRAQGRAVHVALEFFYYPDQARVEAYRLGQISEATFLNEIKWGQPSYDYYREQALFPNLTAGEKTWAINAPRVLTSQVARGGLGSLSSDLQQLLPPEFSLGRDSYRERFQQAMGGHVNPEAIDRYFAAQSIWDDTMAWRLSQIQQMYPQAVIVVVVGEFHTQYGGGLVDRLKARGVSSVMSISQVNTSGLNSEEIKEAIMPHPEYGPRADWIWAAPAVE